MEGYSYIHVAGGQTDYKLTGSTKAGAKGDYLHRVVITTLATSLDSVVIEDGSGSEIPLSPTGTAVGAFSIPIKMTSKNGGWQITTSVLATVVAVGRFT